MTIPIPFNLSLLYPFTALECRLTVLLSHFLLLPPYTLYVSLVSMYTVSLVSMLYVYSGFFTIW